MIRRAYSPARYVHSPRRGGRCIRAAQGFALGYDPPPRGLPPRVSPWAMVHRAYSPAGYVPFGPVGPFGGAYSIRPYTGYVYSAPFGSVWWAYAIRPYPDGRGGGYPASFPASVEAVRRRPEAGAVLIGISVRLHLAFASGFLSVCEGKGLYVRRACQYVILRISSRPCTWPECSFCRRPIYCLSAPYAFRGVPEIHEP